MRLSDLAASATVGFRYGAFGGMAPTLIEIAEGASPAVDQAWYGYALALVIYAIIGGFVTHAMEEERMPKIKAILLGVSAPALIANTLTAAEARATQALFIAPLVHAAQTEDAAPAPPIASVIMTRTLTVEDAAGDRAEGRLYLVLADDDRVFLPATEDGTWRIPTAPVRVVFEGTVSDVRVATEPAEIDAGTESILFRLHMEQTFLGGLLDGLGLERTSRRFIRSSAKIEAAEIEAR